MKSPWRNNHLRRCRGFLLKISSALEKDGKSEGVSSRRGETRSLNLSSNNDSVLQYVFKQCYGEDRHYL